MIRLEHITKTFGSLIANNDISLDIKKSEIHALLGENGAGKSTLMSILFGLYQADSGNIYINDELVMIKNPNDANRLGIGMVHQHFKLVETFTVLENIILGKEDTKYGFLSLIEARKKVEEICETYHLHLDLDEKIKNLTVAAQQRVEIVKMLYRNAEILIFDEPTAVLAPQEIDELMKILKNFAQSGKTIVLITHKLNEIKMVADRCSILKRGVLIKTVDVDKTTTKEMAEMMVGRQINFEYDIPKQKTGKSVLVVEDLVYQVKNEKALVNHVNFEVKSGEILGIAGIDGNGQTQLVEMITGLRTATSGKILLNDKDITKSEIRKRSADGMSHIPENRQKHGLVLDFNLAYNLVLQNYYKEPFQKHGFLDKKAIYDYSDVLIEKFDIRSADGKFSSARSMSGGNQQKAIIAREVDKPHNLMVAVQPTRGLDIGATIYVHQQLINERNNGQAVLLVSLELDEILDLSDRILVIYEGKFVGEFEKDKATAEELGLYMAGIKEGLTHAK